MNAVSTKLEYTTKYELQCDNEHLEHVATTLMHIIVLSQYHCDCVSTL